MKKVYFRKTTEYYLGKEKRQLERYNFLSKLTLQKVNPKPLHKFKNTKKDVLIMCSPLNRVFLSLPKNSKYRIDATLSEVLFDLNQFATFEEFENEGSVLVRKKFKEFFIKDMLPEKRSELFKEIKNLLKKIKRLKNIEIMIISHSFKLKLIEAYIKTNGLIEKNPKLISKFIKNTQKTYDFENGFDVLL